MHPFTTTLFRRHLVSRKKVGIFCGLLYAQFGCKFFFLGNQFLKTHKKAYYFTLIAENHQLIAKPNYRNGIVYPSHSQRHYPYA